MFLDSAPTMDDLSKHSTRQFGARGQHRGGLGRPGGRSEPTGDPFCVFSRVFCARYARLEPSNPAPGSVTPRARDDGSERRDPR